MLYDSRGFNWLLAELNRKDSIAYGWACLNDMQNAEWGYVSLPEIMQLGAVRDKRWTPLAFPEAKKLCYGYLAPVGTDEHYDWWWHEYYEKLEAEYDRMGREATGSDFADFADKVYCSAFGLEGG